jgi:uncharacterized membrane protein (UPF0182 family)
MSQRTFGPTRRRVTPIAVLIALFVLFFLSKFIAASFLIDFEWWREMRQLDTWVSLLMYGTVPVCVVAVIYFAAFWAAYKLGTRRATEMMRTGRTTNLIVICVLALLAIIVANVTVDSWTVVRYFAGLKLPAGAAGYADPIFHQQLRFYFFELPFYNMALFVVLAGTVVSLLVFWVGAHLGQLQNRLPQFATPGTIDLNELTFGGAFDSGFVRTMLTILLIGLAAKFYFDRYDFLTQNHGAYLVGVDWVVDHVTLPLQWLLVLSALASAGLVFSRRPKLALVLLLALPVRYLLPSIVSSVYVRPNELNLEKPYIASHIEATRSAYGLSTNVKEETLAAVSEVKIDYAKHKGLLDNVRLWDWRAFHDTISQIQPLRPYIYRDTDVDRYTIDGKLRQVLLTPRELDIQQIGEAQKRWINPHFVYTHGYGIVMAEANRITTDGLPQLFIENAPPVVHTTSLKLTVPELYYSEIAHEPVFVDTDQPEFNYPSGSQNVHVRYSGKGGFPISSFFLRIAAALTYSDPNILLTSNLTSGSRMMIHRQIMNRVSTLAGFLSWDADPYLVVTNEGHLVWTVDGYMASAQHPYSAELSTEALGQFNYIRNSVKATVDAYTGETHLYIFDSGDPLIAAYARLFPDLLEDESKMPADLREHIRYPETLFRIQAETYRTFHMRDPEAFYNRADLWDLAKTGSKEGSGAASPTYVVAALPGEEQPEFLLITPFTPANKDNLIGFMAARCDGKHYGELVFQQLAKQNIIYGPMQIEARINQDQVISKDLTLWNQQGSQVLRGQTLVLPIENTFLYVAPIYIQASEARMPQLKKVALAMGNRLAYADTYEQALVQLIGDEANVTAGSDEGSPGLPAAREKKLGAAVRQAASDNGMDPNAVLQQAREHLRKYRDLNSQGKFSEAGKELEEVYRLLGQK